MSKLLIDITKRYCNRFSPLLVLN